MKHLKIIFLIGPILLMNYAGYSQKEIFDVISYSAPKNWEKKQNEGGVQYSVSDKKTGAYAIAIITIATTSGATANENFNTDWARLIKTTVTVNDAPSMHAPAEENGWSIVSGTANYTDATRKGMATLLTATGGGKMVSVVLLTNTTQYQQELIGFLNSLELAKAREYISINTTAANNTNFSSVVGLWCNYMLETTGYSINGMPQYTAGYLRKEYCFYPDGTYQFRNKQWLTKAKDISFIYETGTYSVNGNQLTITPQKGKSGFWGKTNSSKEWGSVVKLSDVKLEQVTYTFEIITDPSYGNSIVLKSTTATARDGGAFNAPGDPYEFHYSQKTESAIDNPPGLITGFENKSLTVLDLNKTTNQAASVNTSQNVSSISSNIGRLAGKWGQYLAESNTAGYDWREYYFNTNGTYQFLQKNISYLYQNEIVFAYEKGTYQLNGNQLTISPQSGTVEGWTKAGSDKAGQLLKTEKRTLEKITYTIDFHYFPGIQKTNLVLQYNNTTIRDGAFTSNAAFKNSWLYQRPYNVDKPAIELPPGTTIDLRL